MDGYEQHYALRTKHYGDDEFLAKRWDANANYTSWGFIILLCRCGRYLTKNTSVVLQALWAALESDLTWTGNWETWAFASEALLIAFAV